MLCRRLNQKLQLQSPRVESFVNQGLTAIDESPRVDLSNLNSTIPVHLAGALAFLHLVMALLSLLFQLEEHRVYQTVHLGEHRVSGSLCRCLASYHS